jgi:hypothetical protein
LSFKLSYPENSSFVAVVSCRWAHFPSRFCSYRPHHS